MIKYLLLGFLVALLLTSIVVNFWAVGRPMTKMTIGRAIFENVVNTFVIIFVILVILEI